MRLSRSASGGDVGRFKALGDMLRTIGVPRGNCEEDRPLGARLVPFRRQLGHQLRIAFDDVGLAPNFYAPPPPRVIDQKEVGLGVVREIAERDVLPVAGEIGKADGVVSERLEKVGGTAAMLDVRLPVHVRGGEENTRLRLGQRLADNADVTPFTALPSVTAIISPSNRYCESPLLSAHLGRAESNEIEGKIMRISSTEVIEGGRVLYRIGKIKAASPWHAAKGAPSQDNWRKLALREIIRKAEDILSGEYGVRH